MTAVLPATSDVFTFGLGHHGGEQREFVPRLVEALVGKKVVGAAASADHTAVWTDAGEVFTFGRGLYG